MRQCLGKMKVRYDFSSLRNIIGKYGDMLNNKWNNRHLTSNHIRLQLLLGRIRAG